MTAKAVLFVHTAEGKTFTDVFESPEHLDPQGAAERMLAAIGDDFPGALTSIAVNEEARVIMGNRRMREMGFDGPDYPEYAAPVSTISEEADHA